MIYSDKNKRQQQQQNQWARQSQKTDRQAEALYRRYRAALLQSRTTSYEGVDIHWQVAYKRARLIGGWREYHPSSASQEPVMMIAVGSSTLGAFVYAIAHELGKHAGEDVGGKSIRILAIYIRRLWRRKRTTIEITTALNDVMIAFEILDDLPDEARLALLNVQFNDEEMNGKLLRWDSRLRTWVAHDRERADAESSRADSEHPPPDAGE